MSHPCQSPLVWPCSHQDSYLVGALQLLIMLLQIHLEMMNTNGDSFSKDSSFIILCKD